MATKAGNKSTGDEVWYNDAVMELANDHCGSAAVAEQLLVKGLRAKRVPWSHMLSDGTRVVGDAAFWNGPFLTIDQAENRASIGAPIAPVTPDPPGMLTRAVAIKVSRAAALALVPRSKRKAGPGAGRTYDYDALIAAANRVLARGRPDVKQVFFDQVRAEMPKGLKLPRNDYPTLNDIVGHLWDAGRPVKG